MFYHISEIQRRMLVKGQMYEAGCLILAVDLRLLHDASIIKLISLSHSINTQFYAALIRLVL